MVAALSRPLNMQPAGISRYSSCKTSINVQRSPVLPASQRSVWCKATPEPPSSSPENSSQSAPEQPEKKTNTGNALWKTLSGLFFVSGTVWLCDTLRAVCIHPPIFTSISMHCLHTEVAKTDNRISNSTNLLLAGGDEESWRLIDKKVRHPGTLPIGTCTHTLSTHLKHIACPLCSTNGLS